MSYRAMNSSSPKAVSVKSKLIRKTLHQLLRTTLLAGISAGIIHSTAASSQAEDWANLQIQFLFDGDKVPERKPIVMSKDPECVKLNPNAVDDTLLVDESTKGITNIAMYLDSKKPGIAEADVHPSLVKAPAQGVVLDNVKCVFNPHMMIVRPGQTITIKNSDSMGHNALFSLLNNAAINPLIPAGGSKDVNFPKFEKAPTPVECSIHPWMKAYMIMTEFPYAGLSDEKGVLKISNLPAGKPINFKVWHERSDKSIEKVELNGKDVEWKKGIVELTLKPGDNDLGVVKLKSERFKSN